MHVANSNASLKQVVGEVFGHPLCEGGDKNTFAIAFATPDLIQEIVDRPGWSSGNAMVIIVTGSGRRVAEAYDGYQFHLVYQKLHNFCAGDLGGFYLDVIKDRQYTTRADSKARRSAQTAMHHIGEALVRWVAPILSFTAEEIWQHIPGGREDSVLLSGWYEPDGAFEDQGGLDMEFWQRVITIREAAGKELEKLRGVPVVLNTSLNRRGEPIVCRPRDALDMFYGSDLQYLFIEDLLVRKEK